MQYRAYRFCILKTKKLFELAEFEYPFDIDQGNPSVGVVQAAVVFL